MLEWKAIRHSVRCYLAPCAQQSWWALAKTTYFVSWGWQFIWGQILGQIKLNTLNHDFGSKWRLYHIFWFADSDLNWWVFLDFIIMSIWLIRRWVICSKVGRFAHFVTAWCHRLHLKMSQGIVVKLATSGFPTGGSEWLTIPMCFLKLRQQQFHQQLPPATSLFWESACCYFSLKLISILKFNRLVFGLPNNHHSSSGTLFSGPVQCISTFLS